MIIAIDGIKGSGKTKKIIEHANSSLENVKGDVVFLAATSKYRTEINTKIRFVDTSMEGINSKDSLIGFIKGFLAGNFDISAMYIDGIYKMMGVELDSPEVAEVMSFLEIRSKSDKIDFILTLSCDKNNMPQFLTKYCK